MIPILDGKDIERDADVLRQTLKPIGSQLMNGAVVLAQTEAIRFPCEVITSVVLCVTSGFQPFVVWDRCRDATATADKQETKITDYCVQGRYFRHLDEALDAYKEARENVSTRRTATGTPSVTQRKAEYTHYLKTMSHSDTDD